MPIDRVALHAKTAFDKWEGWAKAIERDRRVTFGDKFIWAPNSVMMSPLFNDAVPQIATARFSDEVAQTIEKYAPNGDILSPEWRMWWKHMPEYRLVSPFACVAGEWGGRRLMAVVGLDPHGLRSRTAPFTSCVKAQWRADAHKTGRR